MTKTEGFHAGEFLLSEGAGSISREQVTLAATAKALPAGQVLGIVTASANTRPTTMRPQMAPRWRWRSCMRPSRPRPIPRR